MVVNQNKVELLAKLSGMKGVFATARRVFGPDIIQRWLGKRFQAFFAVKLGFSTRFAVSYFR